MPFIPPRYDLQSYLAQSTFNMSLPHMDVHIPDIHLPSGPWHAFVNFFLSLYQVITRVLAELPAHAGRVAKELEHAAGVLVLLLVALALAMGAHKWVPFVYHVVRSVLVCVARAILTLVGFTASGVVGGSVAACVQSVVYGAFTRGVFSVLQSVGATLGRFA